jgi:hypothetical protein
LTSFDALGEYLRAMFNLPFGARRPGTLATMMANS